MTGATPARASVSPVRVKCEIRNAECKGRLKAEYWVFLPLGHSAGRIRDVYQVRYPNDFNHYSPSANRSDVLFYLAMRTQPWTKAAASFFQPDVTSDQVVALFDSV